MSEQATGGDTAPQTPEALAADIERTRQELGETVEALVAKTDVKARAQRGAAEVAGNLRDKARDGVRDAKQKARQAREKAPAIPSGSGRIYGTAAAAVTVTLVLAWLALRRRRR